MKLVVISTIRNEDDILEIFVRYHLQIVDRMIIINHRSSDSSAHILQSLKKEGLPIELAEETSLELQQGPFLTRIMKKAVKDYDADWVIPLDADEFIAVSGEGRIHEVMEKLPSDKVVKVPWRTYVPLPSDNFQEPNILKRIQHFRRKENQNLRKIMIPRSLAMKKYGLIAAGNHGVVRESFRKQKELPYVPMDQLVLAHFPVRSSQQIMAKAFVGWLACLSKPNRLPTENYHLKVLYDRFKNGNEISPEELTSMALGYATSSGANALTRKDIVHRPLVPESGDITLRHTDSFTANPLRVLAQMAEEFAEALAAVRRKDSQGNFISEKRWSRWLNLWR
ncbi:MAG TPA: glycosyltransferase family 2 protein [Nitrospirota bacterium]|nr:glycosyltransferase family 2 protein [Nitrospirota bacterium]